MYQRSAGERSGTGPRPDPAPLGTPVRTLASRPAVVAPDLDPRRAHRRQPGGKAPVFAGRHGPLELAAEAVHIDLIPQLAAHHAAFAPPPYLIEAGLLVSLDAGQVPHLQLPPSGSV